MGGGRTAELAIDTGMTVWAAERVGTNLGFLADVLYPISYGLSSS